MGDGDHEEEFDILIKTGLKTGFSKPSSTHFKSSLLQKVSSELVSQFDFEVSDDDNHSTAPTVNGNAPTTNAPSTLALPAEPPQKKPAFQMSAPEDFEVSDDDNHSTTPTVKGNAPTTNAASTLALPAEPPQKKQMSAHEVEAAK
ncbi:hypothetical protein Tco_0956565 [Tanacetum coccineum]